MVAKTRKRRSLSLRKKEWVVIEGDICLPIKTLSISEENRISITMPNKMPSKIQAFSEAEKEEIKKTDPTYSSDKYIATKVYDKTAPAYIAYLEKQEKYAPMLEAVKYIDFDAEIFDDEVNAKVPFHQYLGLSYPINWLEVCEYFDEEGLTDNQAEKIITTTNALKGDSIFQRIRKLQVITGMNYMDLMMSLEEIVDQKNLEVENTADSILEQLDKLSAMKNPETFHSLKTSENDGEEEPTVGE